MTPDLSTITILGTGYVGISSAAIMAAAGYTVYLVDVIPERLESIRQGKAFFYEEGLDPLIADGVAKNKIIPTESYAESVAKSDVVFSCVGTPDNPDGSSNLSYVFAAAEEASQYLKPGSVFVQKSTVPVGTGEKVEVAMAKSGKTIRYVSNPEFLRESTAVYDTLWFDRIVLGGSDAEALEKVMAIYRTIAQHRDSIAELAGISGPKDSPEGQYITTTRNSAELVKVSANAFLALKISFANSIAKLADAAGADITEVMNAVGADPRIGRAFLNAGRGYGGGCFPKDVSGLINSAREFGVDMEIMQAASHLNDSMPGYIAEKLKQQLGNNLAGKKIAVLGLSFKAGTSDTRRSSAIALANILAKEKAAVHAYDPEANKEAKPELDSSITLHNSTVTTAEKADAILVATDWKHFTQLSAVDYSQFAPGAVFVDCMNRFVSEDFKAAGMAYIGVGRS
ncbi:MAG TPA: UDP-glucose/GDP-mannose dehydrogenase family protein [Verrucomicrobiae bacterium]|nr:UDP-glucose/GDP-mannose dehydrogenase family protein [Verrucomicrobiae bacterium]